jgi:hypothetical protein
MPEQSPKSHDPTLSKVTPLNNDNETTSRLTKIDIKFDILNTNLDLLSANIDKLGANIDTKFDRLLKTSATMINIGVGLLIAVVTGVALLFIQG